MVADAWAAGRLGLLTLMMAIAIAAGSEGLSDAIPLVRNGKHLHRASDASPFPAARILRLTISPSIWDRTFLLPCGGTLPSPPGIPCADGAAPGSPHRPRASGAPMHSP